MPPIPVDTTTPLRLAPLTFQPDGDDVVIGRTDIDSYGVFPPDGAALLRKLADGVPPADAGRWYLETYGEAVDLDEFLGVLDELEFLTAAPASESRPVRWQRLGRVVFSRPAMIGYGLLIAAAIAVMVLRPQLAPRTSNLFYTRYVTALAMTVFLGQIPLILLHESFHALAGRRLGMRSTLRISRRLYFLVFETNLDGLVVVPRRKRYLPLMSGMLADALVVAILTLVAAATLRSDGTFPVAGGACRALAFATLIRFSWQFFMYARTDLYAVAVNVLGCQDLHGASRRILANRARRLIGRAPVDEAGLHPRDRRIGRWYAWLMLAGYTFSFSILVLVIAPATWRSLHLATVRLLSGHHSWHEITDSFVFLALMLGQLLLVGFLAVRSRIRRRRQPVPTFLTT